MLQIVWEAWWAQLPRLQAGESLAAYNVAVIAAGNARRADAERVIGSWERLSRRVSEQAEDAGKTFADLWGRCQRVLGLVKDAYRGEAVDVGK